MELSRTSRQPARHGWKIEFGPDKQARFDVLVLLLCSSSRRPSRSRWARHSRTPWKARRAAGRASSPAAPWRDGTPPPSPVRTPCRQKQTTERDELFVSGLQRPEQSPPGSWEINWPCARKTTATKTTHKSRKAEKEKNERRTLGLAVRLRRFVFSKQGGSGKPSRNIYSSCRSAGSVQWAGDPPPPPPAPPAPPQLFSESL